MGYPIDCKISEFWKIRNNTHRYWKKIMRESLKIAKEQNLEIIITDGLIEIKKGQVIVFNNNRLYDENLLRLAKQKFPSLYRKYHQGMKKYAELFSDLKEIYNSF